MTGFWSLRPRSLCAGFWAGERVMGVNQSSSGLRRDDRTLTIAPQVLTRRLLRRRTRYGRKQVLMYQNLTTHTQTLHHKNLHQHSHSLWHNRTKQLGGILPVTLILMSIYALFVFALAAYTWRHRNQNFLMIKKPAPALTRFLKIFTVLFTVVGVFAIIGG